MADHLLYAGSEEPRALLDELSAEVGLTVEFSSHADLSRRFRAFPSRLVIADCEPRPEELFQDIREIRLLDRVPILALVTDARVGTEALDLGADMIAPKPVRLEELVLRVSVLLRRSADEGAAADLGPEIEIDREGQRIVGRNGEVALTPTEFRMLEALTRRAGTVLSHDQLIASIWGGERRDRDEVRLYVTYLRRKLASIGLDPIEIVRGVGFRYRQGPQKANSVA
jgi:two-component system, OmpR family, KDP operon response regulator KdpE